MSKKKIGKSKSKYRKKMRLNDSHQRETYKKKFLNKILKWDDPLLKTVCEPVAENEDIESIKKDMGRVLKFSKDGVGLAANQIGVVKRIILVLIDKKKPTFFINPEIIEKSEDEIINSQESCLSFPSIVGIVKRYKTIKLKYEDENRVIQEKEFTGYNSIVIQHELKHLSGMCDLHIIWIEQREENNKKSSTSAVINKEDKDGG